MFARPKLKHQPPASEVPSTLELSELGAWLNQFEAKQPHVIEGAEARIVYRNPEAPSSTSWVFMFVHGFSATRQETAPVSTLLAEQFDANLVELRLAGHGLAEHAMTASAEDWLQSMVNGFDIAQRLGHRVVMVSTSTGAPLACWVDQQLRSQFGIPYAHLFMAPNFKINNPFDFVLTMPFASQLVPLLLGRERQWTPENDAAARFWTSRYAIQAVIEMQKVVDWFRSQPIRQWQTPMAMMIMDRDPTVSAKAAKKVFAGWQSPHKAHLPITIEPDTIAHVFVGDIAGPQRTQSVVQGFTDFLSALEAQDDL